MERDENVLVATETMDDAAVYKISDEQALVVTADFITPFTDDPYMYGQVAAANSISDIYAMGGRAITVLNLCCFPTQGIETAILEQVLKGGLDKTHEAGAFLVGGHTVRDEEMKYGLSVNGFVHPGKITTNAGARKDDVFILTKPVGSGVHITGARRGMITSEDLKPITRKMAELNKTAAEVMMEFEAGGATDITGFGLGGHTLGIARASKIGIRFNYDAIPKFPKALDLIGQGVSTGLTVELSEQVGSPVGYPRLIAELRIGVDHTEELSNPFYVIQVPDGDFDVCQAVEHGPLGRLIPLLHRDITSQLATVEVAGCMSPHEQDVSNLNSTRSTGRRRIRGR